MSNAVLCPVCMGSGVIEAQPDFKNSTTAMPKQKVCHGCGGKGWVEVGY